MEKEYFRLLAQEQRIGGRMKDLIIKALKENNGKISFTPECEDDEYPVSATLYGKHDCPVIEISDVYLNEHDEIYADGYEQQCGILEKGFEIYPEQYSDILHFIGAVLEWKQGAEEIAEKQEYEVTILFGSEVVCEYSDTGEIPSEDWINEHGGVVDTLTFKSKEYMDAYLEGLNAADGWLETLVLDDFMIKLLNEKRKLGY
jgi:hypothetical protein